MARLPKFTRITVLKIGFLTFAAAIAARAVLFQTGADPRLERLAMRQFSSKVTAMPRRGHIFDRNGEGLAITLKASSLFFRPEILRKELTHSEKNRLLFNLAKFLRLPINTLTAKMKSEKGFVWVKRQLSTSEEQAIKDLRLLDYGDGVGLVEETKRFYPNKELAAHAVGSVNVDGQGLEGLELYYDNVLNGTKVRISSNKDAMGRRIFRDDQGLVAFKDGQSIVLTLDKAMQYEAEKTLRLKIEELSAKAGTVIVAEVETGEILALANYPTFNPNNPKQAYADSRRNRAITDTYEPGSTFKPFIIASALEKGRSPKNRIYCENGSFKVGDRTISEAETKEKFEWLTLGEILKFSSNIGAAKLALELGPETVGEMMKRMGIGRKTGIDLPGEVGGSLSLKELNSKVRLANVGFGHGFTVTPLQMLTYYLSIANGGRWVQPKLVKAVLAEDPESLERGAIRYKLGQRFDELNARKILTPAIASQLTTMLESVVEENGTGAQAQLTDWPVAGKTGTAQKVDTETRHYSREKHIATFAGFAPAKSPKLVALVLLDEPQKKFYAGETAAPAFREIMQACLLREKVPPADSAMRTQQLANRAAIETLVVDEAKPKQNLSPTLNVALSDIPQTNPERNDKSQIRLPNLQGLSVREALRTVGSEPIQFEIIGSGTLKEQVPPSGQWLNAGSKVKLIFQQ
jgi:cell division protein FtsI (penicillin-binding protein 3)